MARSSRPSPLKSPAAREYPKWSYSSAESSINVSAWLQVCPPVAERPEEEP